MSIDTPTREAWLAERRKGIGGSDAPVVLGISPWKSRYELWAEKIGAAEPEALDDRDEILLGTYGESALLRVYAERSARIVEPQHYRITRHPSISWLFASLDGRQEDHMKGAGVVQAKIVALEDDDWRGGRIPLHYEVQLQHEMEAAQVTWGTLLVYFILQRRVAILDRERNADFVGVMLEREGQFWNCVTRGEPPAIDGTEHTRRALHKLFRRDSGAEIYLPSEAAEWDAELRSLKAEAERIERRKTEMENQIKAAMGEATRGILPGGGAYQWKVEPRDGYTVQPSEPRILRKIKR